MTSEAGLYDDVAAVLARVGSAIEALENREPVYRGMRASFAAAIVRERALWIVWAGDVEVARWRRGVVERLTRPHLAVATSAINRSVGSTHIEFERRIEAWEPGDRIVIVTADARAHGDDPVAAVRAAGIGAVLVASAPS